MRKLIIIVAASSALLLNSCSNDRDETPSNDLKIEKTEKKLNLKGNLLKSEDSKVGVMEIDSTKTEPSSGVKAPTTKIDDDSETIDPTKPDRPW